MTGNPYAPPKTDVGRSEDEDRKPTATARFFWTACVAFPVFMACVLMTPRGKWIYGAIGSAVFAGIAGVIALCIPVRTKILFIAPSVLTCLIVVYLIGSSR